jgi:hypothetical protein
MSTDEFILAEEQDVGRRGLGLVKEIEAEVGSGGARSGTLVLTNYRLLFVVAGEKEDDLAEGGLFNPLQQVHLHYADVGDLGELRADPGNIVIPINQITSVVGHKAEFGRPSLELRWREGGGEKGAEFTQHLMGKRRRNLNDWSVVIQRLRDGNQQLLRLPEIPDVGTLEGKIVRVLSDMQDKGPLTIEGAVEEAFKVDCNSDQVQEACDGLVSKGLLQRILDSSGDAFYRKLSPLGDDNLSG